MAEASSKVEHPTTYMETLMHVLKANVGTGLFAMGDAVKNSGLAIGPFAITFLGVLCTYCEHLLLNASQEMKDNLNMDQYPDYAGTVELCFSTGPDKLQKFASVMRKLVNCFLCITQLGFCCVYLVFVASTAQQILEWAGYVFDVRVVMIFITIPVILTCLIRNLKYLAPVSALANLLLFVGLVVTIYYVCRGLEKHETVKLLPGIRRVPLFFGTALFAFAAIATTIPLKSDMLKPQQFDMPLGVLNIGKAISIAIYVMLGTLAYTKYGEDIKGSVTLNIPKDEALAQSVKGCTGFAIMFTYAIQYYVPFQILWFMIVEHQGPFKRSLLVEVGFRIALVLLTFFLAEAIPYLDLFISLVGAFCSAALALLIPPVLEYVRASKNDKLTAWIIGKDIFIFVVGIIGAVTGTTESIVAIVSAVTNSKTSNTNNTNAYAKDVLTWMKSP